MRPWGAGDWAPLGLGHLSQGPRVLSLDESPPPPRCPLLQTRASVETAIRGNRAVTQQASTVTLSVNSDLCATSTARCGDTRERRGVSGDHLHPEGPARLSTGGRDSKVEWE